MPPAARPPSDATLVWAEVADRLEAFARAWEVGPDPPDPAEFVPAGPPGVRRLVLAEVVKLDLDGRLRRGAPRPLEDYLAAFPELADGGGPPCDLLYEDYHLRRRAGAPADAADYYRRFPGRAAELARLLGGAAPTRTTSALAARPPAGLAPGDRVDDFDLLAVLGAGQFATVFLARQGAMQRLVALKVSAVRGAEAQTLARLDHPHVVRVYDQRVLPARGLLLVYMPYLAGGTLLDVLHRVRAVPPGGRSGGTLLEAVDAALDRRGELPPADSPARRRWAGRSWPAAVCAVGAKLAGALDYAHRRDVLHRDVKPANVLLTAEGEPLLADFNVGCCSKLDGAGPAAVFGGSLAYMAPEHLEAFDPAHPRPAESLDGRADLFALAVTLWELLTGERPFGPERVQAGGAGALAALAAGRRAGPSPAAVAAFADADVPGFRAVLVQCLAADPAARPATAGELAAELDLCLRPATRALVRPPAGGWRAAVRRHPLAAILAPAVAVNALASVFNVVYNEAEIVAHWNPDAQAHFRRIIPVVNGVLFPLAILVILAAARPVARGLRRVRAGDLPAPADLAVMRRLALRLGAVMAVVSAGCWVGAGVAWPAALRAAAGPPPGGAATYGHFLLSLAVCGLIAAAYPYFLVTFLSVRVFYPALLGSSGPDPADAPALGRVERDLGRFRAAAAGVPLLAVAALASHGSSSPFAAAALGVAGVAGVAVAYFLEGRTRADLAALAAADG